MYREYYNKEKSMGWQGCMRFFRWKKGYDELGTVRDFIHLLPSVSFWFSRREFIIVFAWVNFTTWIRHNSFKK
jgi:hypothetical protein